MAVCIGQNRIALARRQFSRSMSEACALLTFTHGAANGSSPPLLPLESDSKLTERSQLLARCRVTRLICAMRIQAELCGNLGDGVI
jgi:hypothetical protein